MNTATSIPLPLLTLAAVGASSVALVWIATLLLRRKSAALRHLLWVIALCAPLLALPIVSWPHAPRISLPVLPPPQLPVHPSIATDHGAIPSITTPVVIRQTGAATTDTPVSVSSKRHDRFGLPFNPWLAVWLAGAAFVAARILNSYWRAKRLLRSGCFPDRGDLSSHLDAALKSFRLARPVRLMVTRLVEIPFCHGIFRPAIIFPESWRDWDTERVDICMAHEMAHVARRDLLAMFASQAACVLCWFNPLVWLAAAKLRDEAEVAADDMVLARDIRPETYASTLLAITEKCRVPAFPPATALSMARPSRLKTRIVAILDSSLQRQSPGLRVILALSLLAAIAVISAVSIRLTTARATAADSKPVTASNFLPTNPEKREAILEQVRKAIEADDIKAVDSFLKKGLNVNELYDEDPLLYWALDANKPDMVKFLIARGADVNKPTQWGDTCLKRACWRGFKEIADILLKAGAKHDHKNDLFYCCGTGDVKGLEALDAKNPIKGDGTEGDEVEGCMSFASASGHPNTLAWLWKHKAPPDPAKKEKLLGIIYVKAATWGQTDVLRYLETLGNPSAESLHDALCEAATWNFVDTVKYLLDKGVSPNSHSEHWNPPLRDAAGEGRIELVKLLLDHGADINALDSEGMTSLAWAGYCGYDNVCTLLVERGADGTIADKTGENAAWYCAGGAHCPVALEMMLKKGVKVTGKNTNGWTIIEAMMNFVPPRPGQIGFPGKVYTDAEIKDYAARERHVIDLLIGAGADVNSAGPNRTPLMHALTSDHYEGAMELINHGADLTAKDANGNIAMSYLFEWGGEPVQLDLLDTMLKHGCDPNAPNFEYGVKPPLEFPIIELAMAYKGSFDMNQDPENDAHVRAAVKMLLDHGAVFPKTADANVQALLKAAALGDLDAMKNAVKQGASVDSADGNGWNALTICLALDYRDCVKWLLSNKANPDTHTLQGQSPLLFAVKRNETDLVDSFIAAGVKPDASGLDDAILSRNQHIFDALLKAGASAKNVPLYWCIEGGQVAMAKALLDAGDDPDPPHPMEDRNDVYWAVSNNQPEILRMLLEHGANPALKDAYGETPLSVASMFHYDEMASILVPYVKKAGGVAKLAATLANAEAKKNFGVEPFSASGGDPDFKDGRWQWHAVAGYGKEDLEANVSFAANESEPKAEVKEMTNMNNANVPWGR